MELERHRFAVREGWQNLVDLSRGLSIDREAMAEEYAQTARLGRIRLTMVLNLSALPLN